MALFIINKNYRMQINASGKWSKIEHFNKLSFDKLTCIYSCLGRPYLFEFYNNGRIFLKSKIYD